MAKGDAARIWIGAWPTIPLLSIYPSSWAFFGWVLGSQECAWEAHRLWGSLADKWSVYLWDKFSNCCLKCKIFWPALPPLGCDRRGIASDQWVCKQLYYTLLGQDMEEQANLKDLLKQYLQDFFFPPSHNNSSFFCSSGKGFFKMFSFHGWHFPLRLLATELVSNFLPYFQTLRFKDNVCQSSGIKVAYLYHCHCHQL